MFFIRSIFIRKISIVLIFICYTHAGAEQVTGTLGSPSATTTIINK